MVKSENLVFEKQLEKNKQQLRTGVLFLFYLFYFFLMNSSRMHTGRNMEVKGIKFTKKNLYYKLVILGKFSAMWRKHASCRWYKQKYRASRVCVFKLLLIFIFWWIICSSGRIKELVLCDCFLLFVIFDEMVPLSISSFYTTNHAPPLLSLTTRNG